MRGDNAPGIYEWSAHTRQAMCLDLRFYDFGEYVELALCEGIGNTQEPKPLSP